MDSPAINAHVRVQTRLAAPEFRESNQVEEAKDMKHYPSEEILSDRVRASMERSIMTRRLAIRRIAKLIAKRRARQTRDWFMFGKQPD